MRLTWNAVYALLWVYRSTFSVLAETFIRRLTDISDTQGYLQFGVTQLAGMWATTSVETSPFMQRNANVVTQVVAGILNGVTGGTPVLVNIGFQTIAFIGIVYFLRGLDARARIFALIVLVTPTFTLWTSMASKEAIVVLMVAVVARYVVDIHYNRNRLRWWHLVTVAILWMFKPQFAPAVIFAVGTSLLAQRVRERTSLAVIAGSASLALLYAVRDLVDYYALIVARWMGTEAGASNRSEVLLVGQYDVFVRAPEGMLMSFMGPTWSEAAAGGTKIFAMMESSVIVAVLLLLVVWRLPRMPVYSAVLGLFTLFWTLFPTYPFGLSNPGTAIRYRADYLILVVLAVAVLTARGVFVNWQPLRRRRRALAMTAPVPAPTTRLAAPAE